MPRLTKTPVDKIFPQVKEALADTNASALENVRVAVKNLITGDTNADSVVLLYTLHMLIRAEQNRREANGGNGHKTATPQQPQAPAPKAETPSTPAPVQAKK